MTVVAVTITVGHVEDVELVVSEVVVVVCELVVAVAA